MSQSIVAIVRYEKPFESVRKAVDLSHGLDQLSAEAKVFIKPNLILWRGISPASPTGFVKAFRKAGIDVDPAFFEKNTTLPKFFKRGYEGNPEFDESFFRVE